MRDFMPHDEIDGGYAAITRRGNRHREGKHDRLQKGNTGGVRLGRFARLAAGGRRGKMVFRHSNFL
jgi:hypothetical protein